MVVSYSISPGLDRTPPHCCAHHAQNQTPTVVAPASSCLLTPTPFSKQAPMSVPVSTTVEGHGLPSEYKSGEMNSMTGDGGHERKVAFITGTTGQDGSYLVELLLEKGTFHSGVSLVASRAIYTTRGATTTTLSDRLETPFETYAASSFWPPTWTRTRVLLEPTLTVKSLNHPKTGYIVHGIKRRSSSYNHPRLEHIMEEGTWSFGGIRDLCICTVFLSHPFARALDRCTEADPVV